MSRQYQILRANVLLTPILLVAAVALVLPAPARAEAAAVLVVSPPEPPAALAEAVSRLRGELLSLGLQVRIETRPGSRKSGARDQDAHGSVPRTAADGAPAAVIEAVATASALAMDISIIDRRRGTTEVSRVSFESQVDNAPSRLAIRAVEVLRSSLLAMDLAARERHVAPTNLPAAAAGETPAAAGRASEPAAGVSRVPTPSPREPASDRRLALAAGAALLTSLDGVGPALLPVGRVEWTARPWLALQATVAGLGSRPTITADAMTGRARVAQQAGTLGVCLCAPPQDAIGLHLALSVGALRTAIDAAADAPAQVHPIRRWSLLIDASVGARLRLLSRTMLTVAAHVQVAEPSIAIHFIDTQVASTGRPNVLLSLTVGAWL